MVKWYIGVLCSMVGLVHGQSVLSWSFKNPKTQIFIDLFLGNNGLSKTELETIFPIYL
jgi:hypothetical protein